ncbi:MAG: RNA methyltransferase [Bacteroidota bacterium]
MNRPKRKLEELNRLSVEAFREAEKRPLVVILDQVRSMHNVGSVFRSADAFRIEKLYLCGITPKPPHREIRKTAIGATESVAWEAAEDALAVCQQLQAEGYQILALEQAHNSVMLPDFETQANQKYAVVVGHEVDGVQQAIVDMADTVLEIPQFGTKHSLNVSVASGVILYALTKF